ncbi:MAG: NADH:ubiquinone reductase (Na(+)-transporting) subunit C [Lewinellaceae bacterium]|nr:NADH:ubiquinone reductase (Na(+)-transporting) subunit C [Lewinellaceae bacterium]
MYAAGLSVITAIILAFTSEALKPAQEANVALEKKSNILRSVRLELTDRNAIESTYNGHIQALVVDNKGEVLSDVKPDEIELRKEVAKPEADRRLPLYVYTGDNQEKYYILPMSGTGLWGPIWGYLSIEGDFNTVHGAFFDHKSETPGLGAEIAEKPFQDQFPGKKIMSDNNQFVSVHVLKVTDKFDGGAEHRVDGISGGTITSRGTDDMLRNCLSPYIPYFEKIKSSGQ